MLKDNWISVADRLPEPGIDVLVYLAATDKYNAAYAVSRLTAIVGGWLNCGYSRRCDVTFWQPLPDDPPLDRLARQPDPADEGQDSAKGE